MKLVNRAKIQGCITAPGSKSMMCRAVIASALASGKSTILNPSFCDDGLAAMEIAKSLGAEIKIRGRKVEIEGRGIEGVPAGRLLLDCGESGLCLRLMSAVGALMQKEVELIGRGSLLSRPVEMVEGPIRSLGGMCTTNNGKLPIRIKGPIRGGKVSVDGSESSQFLTGLIMALPLCKEDSEIEIRNLKSKPYVRMTVSMLRKFGVEVEHDEKLESIWIKGGQNYNPTKYQIEGDWSGAAFMLVAGAIAGEVVVDGLEAESLQADRAVVEALKLAGAEVEELKDEVKVRRGKLEGFSFDATDCPDLFPPLVALASNCKGISRIKGAKRLLNKESNRADVLVREFGKIGGNVRIEGDEMVVEYAEILGGGIESHNDHRIAMAGAIAGLNSRNGVRIEGESCISKSYPEFFTDLEKLKVKK